MFISALYSYHNDRKIYTDRALGEQNLKMIEIAKKVCFDFLSCPHTGTSCLRIDYGLKVV
jgi:hypothetical protein